MKVIIAGSRTIEDYVLLCSVIKESGMTITEVVSGGAQGVDKLGERWAKAHKIPVKSFPADWKKFGKAAGRVRNVDMSKYANAAIILWDGWSPGTKHMISVLHAEHKNYFLEICTKPHKEKEEKD